MCQPLSPHEESMDLEKCNVTIATGSGLGWHCEFLCDAADGNANTLVVAENGSAFINAASVQICDLGCEFNIC